MIKHKKYSLEFQFQIWKIKFLSLLSEFILLLANSLFNGKIKSIGQPPNQFLNADLFVRLSVLVGLVSLLNWPLQALFNGQQNNIISKPASEWYRFVGQFWRQKAANESILVPFWWPTNHLVFLFPCFGHSKY